MIKTKYGWDERKQAFLGIVYDEVKDETLILTIGMMKTVKGIKDWLDDTVSRKAWEDDSELPDMCDTVQ